MRNLCIISNDILVLPDFCFSQGIFDIIPFAYDDIEAKGALWSILERLLICIEVSECNPSSLHQYISILVSKSDVIEEEFVDLQLADASEEGKSFTDGTYRRTRTRTVSFLSILLHFVHQVCSQFCLVISTFLSANHMPYHGSPLPPQ